jgi:hypothetical protein
VPQRLTRWEKTREDWPGFKLRDVWLGLLAGAVTVGVLALLGFPWAAIAEVLVSVGAIVAVALLFALLQLWWAWSQAPMRLLVNDNAQLRSEVAELRDEVRALPEKIGAPPGEATAPVAPAEPPPLELPLEARNQARIGEELGTGRGYFTEDEFARFDGWADDVVQRLSRRGAEEELEEFLAASDGLPDVPSGIAAGSTS